MVKKILVSSLAAGLLALSPTAHALLWTYTATGTIAAGQDQIGLFGGSLTGKSYSISMTFDPTLETTVSSLTDLRAQGGGGSAAFSFSATIGGVTYSSNVTKANSNSTYAELQSFNGGASNYSGARFFMLGNADSNNNFVRIDANIWSWLTDITPAEIPPDPLSWLSSFNYTSNGNASAASFQLNTIGGQETSFFNSAVQSITITADNGPPVPEPATAFLAGAALAALQLRRRKA